MLKALIRAGSILVLCALSSLAASAQTTVINPRTVEFDPSADHSALSADGQPVVARYDLQVFLQGATLPVTTTSLGKPAIDTDGKIRVDFSTLLVGWPLPDGTYEARVAAVGPSGTGESDLSNTFGFETSVPPPCTFSLSGASLSAGANGASGSVTVTSSAATCGWTGSSNAAWVTVSPASGTGTGTVGLAVAANTGVARTATVTLGGQAYTVSQAAVPPPCTFALSGASLSAGANGASGSVTVTASAATCGWTASSDAAWVTVSPASGTGTGTVGLAVAANTGVARTATVTLGGQAYTVSQAAVPPPCTFALSGASLSAGANGASGSVTVTASAATCGWTASSDAAWVTVSPASGTGTGTVGLAVAPNTGVARTATVTLGGQACTVSQAAAPPPCTFSLSGASLSAGANGASGSVTVTASAATCGWTASSNAAWVTVSPASGTGTGTVGLAVAANTGVARTATVTLGGQACTVSQAAAPPPCTFSLSPQSVSVSGTAATLKAALTASAGSCAWTASKSVSWITLGTTSGSGNASVTYVLSQNPNGASRTGTITIGGQGLTVTQAAAARPSSPKGVRVQR